MSIAKNGNGEIIYTPRVDRLRSDIYGVHTAEEFQVADNNDQLKQVKFDLASMASASRVKLLFQNGTPDSEITLTFPSTNTTISGGGGGFSIFQCDAGTSPTASPTDTTLTLTSSSSQLTITGNATTDTVTFAMPNLSGTNTGDITLDAVGSTPSANGASLSGQVLTLQPASATLPGVITAGTQTFGGTKTFADVILSGNVAFTSVTNSSLSGSNARIPSHTTSNLIFTNASLTSIASANNGGVVDGHTMFITNGTGNSITVINNYASASAGEKIYTGTGADLIVPANSAFFLLYSSSLSCWTAVATGLTNLASSQVTGVLPIANGGTNASSLTSTYGLYFDGTRLAGSSTFIQYDGSGHTGIGGASSASFALQVTGKSNFTDILTVKLPGANQDGLRITNSAGTRTASFGFTSASDLGFYLQTSINVYDVWYQGWHSFGCTGATPLYTWDFYYPDTSTTPLTDIVRNSGTRNIPVIMVRNSSATNNNFSGIVMAGASTASTAPSCELLAIHTAHTNSAESANFNLNLRNAGTIATQLAITAAGAFTIGAASSTNKHALNTATSAANTGVGTLTNMPTGISGNPTGYISITINGSDRVIPYW